MDSTQKVFWHEGDTFDSVLSPGIYLNTDRKQMFRSRLQNTNSNTKWRERREELSFPDVNLSQLLDIQRSALANPSNVLPRKRDKSWIILVKLIFTCINILLTENNRAIIFLIQLAYSYLLTLINFPDNMYMFFPQDVSQFLSVLSVWILFQATLERYSEVLFSPTSIF